MIEILSKINGYFNFVSYLSTSTSMGMALTIRIYSTYSCVKSVKPRSRRVIMKVCIEFLLPHTPRILTTAATLHIYLIIEYLVNVVHILYQNLLHIYLIIEYLVNVIHILYHILLHIYLIIQYLVNVTSVLHISM